MKGDDSPPMFAKMKTVSILCVPLILIALCFACASDGDDKSLKKPDAHFWALNFSADKYYLLAANKIGESEHAVFYADVAALNSGWVPQGIEGKIGATFDNIYEHVTKVFGSEPNPGVDSSSKVVILLLDILDGYDPDTSSGYVAGYFDPVNLFTREQLEEMQENTHTNEHEMIYLDVNPGKPGSDTFLRTLAHEFSHMIIYNQKTLASDLEVFEETWVSETMAMLAEEVAGFDPYYPRVKLYLDSPDFEFYDWQMDIRSYATGYMWAEYLYERFFDSTNGNIVSNIVQAPVGGEVLNGIEAIEYSLEQNGIELTFDELYRDWNIAVIMESLQIAQDPYLYPDLDLVGTVDEIDLFGVTMIADPDSAGSLQAWSHRFSFFDKADAVSFEAIGNAKAVMYDGDQIVVDVTPGESYPIESRMYFCIRNSGDLDLGQAGYFQTAAPPPAPSSMHIIAQSNLLHKIAAMTGEPTPVDIGPIVRGEIR